MLHVSVPASGWKMKGKLLMRSLSCYWLQQLEMMLKTCQNLSHQYCLWIQRRDVVRCILYVFWIWFERIGRSSKCNKNLDNFQLFLLFCTSSEANKSLASFGACQLIFFWLRSEENFLFPFCVSNKIELVILCLWMSLHLSSKVAKWS